MAMTRLFVVTSLVTVVFVAVAAFAAVAALAATGFATVVLATAVAFAAMVGFAAVAIFATVAATAFSAFTGFPAFTAFTDFFRLFSFFAWTFVGDAKAFAVDAWRFVLVEAGAARSTASANAGQSQRAAGAKHEKPDRDEGRETLLHERSFLLWSAGPACCAHCPQLYSVECKRVKSGALVAKYVGDVLQIIGEAFVFM
ncbi:MAG: hypothetical protein WAN93_11435 [Solirubrobacteraceae bacterium]